MKYIELFGIPFLMLSDYYLTVLGRVYWKAKWGKHFITETYELNPIWRKDIENIKWINYKHLIIVTIFTAYIYLLMKSDHTESYEYLFGFFYTTLGLVNGRHLNNIFLFRYIIRHPNEISGKINLTHMLVLKISQFHIIITAFTILILTILIPNPFLIGGLFSCINLYFVHIFWIVKHRKKNQTLPTIESKENRSV